MRFPYGVCDFNKIITDKLFYCDRTDRIASLENTGYYLLLLRPRRFGKSLLLSMLENYYDLARKEKFQELFGHLLIGKNPTPLHNKYFILKWDFSCVDPSGSAENIKRAFHNHINACIRSFRINYEDYLHRKIEIDSDDAVSSIKSLLDVVRKTPYPVYLLIDEYDNFANEVMMGVRREKKDIYEAFVYEEGPLKTLFKAVKSSTDGSGFDRSFITGVSPVVMSDITSGYNIAKNIYLDSEFNDLCGFHENEIEKALKTISAECGLKEKDIAEALDLMRVYYDGYKFAPDAEDSIYNPTLAIYFIEAFFKTCKYPRKMLDSNLAADDAKLRYISQIPKGGQLLLDLMRKNHSLIISDLSDRFGIEQMLTDRSKDFVFMSSFLYYFGVLTIDDETEEGELILRVPNLVTQALYVERIQQMLLPEPADRDDGVFVAKQLYAKGNMEPLCEFVEQRFFKVFHNRDYRWANELTVKTAFLTLLYNDILYIIDSEKDAGSGYADLAMIIRPDMKRFKILDILIEFKYISLKEAGLTGEDARGLSMKDLQAIPAMQAKMKEAKKQVKQYGDALEQKYDDLRLNRHAVVSLGFERLWWQEVKAQR
ncbi:MAG: AAA family ATPase [Desulfobacteraceae bacterium]|nr:AAA family ATPase [Desulfobacteraceae bacterium]MBC2719835.1 AAA family ATPase [Desulfobacteraceae bacterium]